MGTTAMWSDSTTSSSAPLPSCQSTLPPPLCYIGGKKSYMQRQRCLPSIPSSLEYQWTCHLRTSWYPVRSSMSPYPLTLWKRRRELAGRKRRSKELGKGGWLEVKRRD